MGYKLRFDPSRIEAFQALELQKMQGLSLAVGEPIMLRNEAREQMNLEPIAESVAPAPTESKAKDINRWMKKVASKGRHASFSSDTLNDTEIGIIRERLSTDLTIQEVFRPPFVGF